MGYLLTEVMISFNNPFYNNNVFWSQAVAVASKASLFCVASRVPPLPAPPPTAPARLNLRHLPSLERATCVWSQFMGEMPHTRSLSHRVY